MLFRRSIVRLLVITLAVLFVGSTGTAFSLVGGCFGGLRAGTFDVPCSCPACRRDASFADFSEQGGGLFPTCMCRSEQAPAASSIVRSQDSKRTAVAKTLYRDPTQTLLPCISSRPTEIYPHPGFGDTLALLNCALLI